VKFSENIFRAYDIRGVYESEITPELMMELGKAFGTHIKSGSEIVVGRDTRFSSQLLELAFCSGVLLTGVDVIDLGVSPIGMLSLGISRLKTRGGALIGASHNPLEFNGIKFFSEGGLYSTKLNEKIKRIFKSRKFRIERKKVGKFEVRDIKKKYIEFVASKVKIERKLRVGIDCMNGSTSVIASDLFKEIGIETFLLHTKTRLLSTPEPLPEKVRSLRVLIRKRKLDLGFAFDGDGDRLLVLDEFGNAISSSKIGAFLIKTFARKNDRIVANVECSSILEEVSSEVGAKVIRVRVGRTFTLEALEKYGGIIGIERVGHFFLPKVSKIDDALLISAKICELISKLNKSFSEIMKEIPEYPSKRISVFCPDEKKFRVVENLSRKFEKKFRVEKIDGVKIILDDAWVLVRASNTEPAIRINVEARNKKKLEELVKKYVKIVRKEVRKV